MSAPSSADLMISEQRARFRAEVGLDIVRHEPDPPEPDTGSVRPAS